MEERLRKYLWYVDVADAEKEVYVFLRHVSPTTFQTVASIIDDLGAELVNTGTSGEGQRATWKVQKPLIRVLEERVPVNELPNLHTAHYEPDEVQ